MEVLLDEGTMEIHGDGQQVRTFTYITDTVDGIVRAMRTPEARGEVLNIGGSQPSTILELAAAVQEALGLPLPLRASFLPYDQLPGKYQDVRLRIPDTTKARELIGFDAVVRLEEGLARTAEWHLARREALAVTKAVA
jgi:UDP-glucose 4-epimerase